MAKTKLTLDIEYDYEFILIGISCHSRDYKLCWAINKQQGFNFIKEAEIELTTKKTKLQLHSPDFRLLMKTRDYITY